MQSLPLFPTFLDPNLERAFALLCDDISPLKTADLLEEISQHIQNVHTALQKNEFIDLALAERIAQTLGQLLQDFTDFPEDKRQLIIGAARYFTRSQDLQSDFSSILGFDDDAAVLNYVLKEIGRSDLMIEL